MAHVYWIHLPEHDDITSQGYVGVSTKVENRLKDHFYMLENEKHENVHLNNAFKKHGNIILKNILLEGAEKYCYEIENKLRPNKHTGWNIAEGGSRPPIQFGNVNAKGHKRTEEQKQQAKKAITKYNKSEEHRLTASKTMKGKAKSENQKRKQSEKMKGLLIGGKNAMSDPINRLKVAQSKIGLKALIKNDIKKMAIPNSEKWNDLIAIGFVPKR